MSSLREYILTSRYLQSGESTFEDIAKRVSNALGTTENEKQAFYNAMVNKLFLPGGRTLACAGSKRVLIPNCVVLPVNDTLEDIFETQKRAALLQQAGCGLGFNFSNLRPAGYPCVRTGGKSSGPISYINHYSGAFQIVQQFNRSGANIGILSIEHPDILAFIHMKDDPNVLNNFNISVLITKRFMDQLKHNPNELWYCRFNGEDVKPRAITYDGKYNVLDITSADITANELWDEIVHAAWSSGEPGLLFEDRMNENNLLLDVLGKMDGVNPCGELALYPNECCNLGSINLEEFCDVNPNYGSTSLDELIPFVHFDKLHDTIALATIFLNRVIDNMEIPDAHLRKFVKVLRRIGLGFMGFADMLIKLKVAYGSPLSIQLMERIGKTFRETTQLVTRSLVSTYGSVAQRLKSAITTSHEYFPLTTDVEKIMAIRDDDELNRIANIACTCIPPTGSTSMIFEVSTGIEPYFSVAYRRYVKQAGINEIVLNKHLETYLRNEGLYTDGVLNDIVNNGLQNCECIPNHVKEVFSTAQDITPSAHILMQAAAQKYIDNSISKTCNFVNSASKDDVKRIYELAYELHCKGTTVYRDGSRSSQVLTDTSRSPSVDSCSSGMC